MLNQIENKILNNEYEVQKPKYKRYSESHIFDENKSVKWNKEKVAVENENNIKEHQEYWIAKGQAEEKMMNDVVNAFAKEYKLSKAKLEVIYFKALLDCSNYHELFNDIENLIDFYLEVNDAK